MKDFHEIIQGHFGQLTNEELITIQSYFQEEKLHKNDFFTKTNTVCNKLGLIKSGILRIYALADDKEITQWISVENDLITEVSGFFFDQPNRWTIQAFTDIELLTITKDNYHKMCKEFPKWNTIEKSLIVQCFATIENRIFSHLSMTAEERYALYFEQNKTLFNRVPLKHIASVLGMTPETLSRIRNRHIEIS